MTTILVGGFVHELHSFAGTAMSLADIARAGFVLEGDAVLGEGVGRGQEMNAVIDIAAERGIRLLPTIFAWGGNGPPVEDAAYRSIRDGIVAGVASHRGETDGILLVLHGAGATTSIEDAEGDLVAHVRAAAGPKVPIAVTFDLHANATAATVDNADILVGYRTCPHTDYYETGARAFRLLLAAIAGEIRPVTRLARIRMVTAAEAHDTTRDPMARVMADALASEATPGILAVSVFACQPWMDVADLGWSVAVVADGRPDLAEEVAADLARTTWARREAFRITKVPLAAAVARARAADAGPIVLGDGADATSGGANGDGNEILRELLDSGFDQAALVCAVDPAAVSACFAAGIDATLTIPVGGTLTPEHFRPVVVTGTVVTLAAGRMRSEVPVRTRDVGRLAVLESGSISIVLTERKPFSLDESLYHRAGLDPRTAKVVQVKSAGGFRYVYGQFAAEIIDVDTAGPCPSDLTRLPFRRIARPMWPFDREVDEPVLPAAVAAAQGDAATRVGDAVERAGIAALPEENR